MAELESQLKEQFDRTIQHPGAVDEFNFIMDVHQSDSLIFERNGYSFMEVNISDLRSFSTRVTICWKSDSISNLSQVHTSKVNSRTVEFAWTNDFPVLEYQNVIVPQVKKSKGQDGFEFDLNIYLYTFPDVFLTYTFVNEPDTSTLQLINLEFEKINKRKHIFYFSGLKEYGGTYSMIVDFDSIDYDNFDQIEMEKYIECLIDIHRRMSKTKVGKEIESVTLM
ncbi:MAG: hypothetical protein ACJASQ_001022 [Crocinitomicaceae bacterium]|jgi:hypothetical protein